MEHGAKKIFKEGWFSPIININEQDKNEDIGDYLWENI